MRITGGHYRSRQLRAPRGDATRPTSDRVREALFSILGGLGALDGARVLDLYAGTGALALEALSRGATQATLVESGREALAAIRANVSTLGVERQVTVVAQTVERAGRALESGAYDLVFADPPYADVRSGAAVRAVEVIAHAALVQGEDALLVLEHASADTAPVVVGFRLEDSRRYGDTALSFFRRDAGGDDRGDDRGQSEL
jgi:16S rRNA (guanine(966)-N(2))-methyltransferase RsmD